MAFVEISAKLFATLGAPNGFQQSDRHIPSLDLNTRAIRLGLGTEIYAIDKFISNKALNLLYSKYVQCFEANSNREGSFIGGSYMLNHTFADESVLLESLDDYVKAICEENLDREHRLLGEIRSVKDIKCRREPLKNNQIPNRENKALLKELYSSDYTSSRSYIIIDYSAYKTQPLSAIMAKALSLLNQYDTIYFINERGTLDNARKQGIYRIVPFQDIEQELERVEREKNKVITKFRGTIESDIVFYQRRQDNDIEELKAKQESCRQANQENDKLISDIETVIAELKDVFGVYKRSLNQILQELNIDRYIKKAKEQKAKIGEEYQSSQRIIYDKLSGRRIRQEQRPVSKISFQQDAYVEEQAKRKPLSESYREGKEKERQEPSLFLQIIHWTMAFCFGVCAVFAYDFLWGEKTYSKDEYKALETKNKSLSEENKELKAFEKQVTEFEFCLYKIKPNEYLEGFLDKKFELSADSLRILNGWKENYNPKREEIMKVPCPKRKSK